MSHRTDEPSVAGDRGGAIESEAEAEAPAKARTPPAPTSPGARAGSPAARQDGPRRFLKRPRQTRVVIRKVAPWSVFKFSLLFYFCVMLIVLLALGMLYSVLGAIGALDSVTKLARDLFADNSFEIHGDWIFTRLMLVGIAMVIVWSLINVFVVFLYNLIADVVGGFEITLAERR